MVFVQNADPRILTEYMSSCELNNNIQTANGIKSPHEYRMFLQRNGLKLMQNNTKSTQQIICSCNKCNIVDPRSAGVTPQSNYTNTEFCKLK